MKHASVRCRDRGLGHAVRDRQIEARELKGGRTRGVYQSLYEPAKIGNVTHRQASSANISGNPTMSVCLSRAARRRVAVMPQVRLCTMVLVLVTAGCAGSMGTMHPDTTVAPVTTFDGSYRTTIRVTSTAGVAKGTNWCETSGQPIITVANGQFSYTVPHPNVPGNPSPTFLATMATDGTFIGQGNDGTILGQVNGTHIDGSIDGSGCGYDFTGGRM